MAGSQERVERGLAALCAADVAEYVHLMAQDEVGTDVALGQFGQAVGVSEKTIREGLRLAGVPE